MLKWYSKYEWSLLNYQSNGISCHILVISSPMFYHILSFVSSHVILNFCANYNFAKYEHCNEGHHWVFKHVKCIAEGHCCFSFSHGFQKLYPPNRYITFFPLPFYLGGSLSFIHKRPFVASLKCYNDANICNAYFLLN